MGVSYQKSEETQKKLKRAMMHLLRTRGFHATSVSDVLKHAAVPKGSLYHQFPGGKLELAVAALGDANDRVVGYLEGIAQQAKDPMHAVDLFCSYYRTEFKAGGFERGCPLATITLEAAATVDPIQEIVSEGFDRMARVFSDLMVEKGVKRKKANQLALLTISSIEGALMLSKAKRSATPLTTIAAHINQQIEEALEAAHDS